MKEFGVGTDILEVIYPPMEFPEEGAFAGDRGERPIVEGDYILNPPNSGLCWRAPGCEKGMTWML